jgi:hypothetical protein
MCRNFNVLAAAELAGGFLDLGLIEVEHEVDFLAGHYGIVTVAGLALLGIIKRQALAITQ